MEQVSQFIVIEETIIILTIETCALTGVYENKREGVYSISPPISPSADKPTFSLNTRVTPSISPPYISHPRISPPA